MSSRLNPYLSFAGNAREAMEFYESVFGGDMHVNTFGEYGGAPDGLKDESVMHAQLETSAGFTLMASDMTAQDDATGPAVSNGNGAFSVSLSGDDAEEMKGYWEKLTTRATITMPLERQMWGDEFGMLIDEFGVNWMVNIGPQTGQG